MNRSTVKGREIYAVLILLLITFAVYWQVAGHDFVYFDDNAYITENPNVLQGFSLESIIWAFTSVHSSNWHPLTWLSHMLDIELFGLNPGWHHLVNVLFHVLNTLLLFYVLKRMTGAFWRSLFVAALFALHPLHVESVAWIAERKDVLSTFFWMLVMWFYVIYTEKPGLGRYSLVLLFFILGLLSKPMLVTLPFVLLLLDYWPLSRFEIWPKLKISFRIIWEKVPFFALVIISSVVTFIVQEEARGTRVYEILPLQARISNALVSYISYITKMLWPENLAALYPHSLVIPSWKVLISAIMLVLITFFVIRELKRRPFLSVGWFWYLGTLVPVIGLVQIGLQAMADRYTYIPLIGIFIMLSWGFSEIAVKMSFQKKIFPVVSLVVFVFLVFLTWVQVGYWKNTNLLFENVLRKTENNFIVHNYLGVVLDKQGNAEESVKHLKKALEINPYYSRARNNLGVIFEREGRHDEAIAHYKRAIQVKPDYADAHNNLGFALNKKGRTEEAIYHYQKALSIDPDYADAHNNLGIALAQKGRLNEAMSHYYEAIRINPYYVEAHNNLGAALLYMGKPEDAILHFKKAVRLDPSQERTHANLGMVLGQLGRFDEAVYHLKKTIEINPDNAKAHNNLGVALAQLGRFDEAVSRFQEALKIKPDYQDAESNLKSILIMIEKAKKSNQ